MRDTLSNWNLFQRVVIRLLFVAIGLVVVFLALAWFTGSLKLPKFLLRSSSQEIPTKLVINVIPVDSMIMLNDQPYDPKSIPLPGDYTVRVTHDGHLTAEEHVRIHPNQKNELIIWLMPIITVRSIADDAAIPGWDQQGNLFFLNLLEGKIYKWSDNTPTPVVYVVGEIYQLIYLPVGTHALALAVEGPESESKLQMIDLQTGDVTDLDGTGFVTLGPDGETLWGFNYDTTDNKEKPIWSLEPGGLPKVFSLENSQWATYGDQLLVDPSGQWLAIESSKGIAIWEIATGKLMAAFEDATDPVWVQNPQPGIAFISADHSLNFARVELDWESVRLLSNVQSPLVSMPSGSDIVFTRYNPFVGGSSFWAVDTATTGVRLLSEAEIESGRVEQFAISPDGKKIAFVNQKNILFLITLEP